MFPKHLRVTVQDFRHNPSVLQRYPWSHGSIQVKSASGAYVRIGIVTPKRIDKRSSCRHQSRRYLVEILRPMIDSLQSHDVLITLSRLIADENRDVLANELKQLFIRKGLVK